MGGDWTEVTIRGVVIDPMSGEPTVLLDDHDETAIIAVPSDPSNAVTIISELEGLSRDLSKSLLYRFFVRHGVAVENVGLSRDRSGAMSASVHYRFHGEQYTIEVRPIEALLIALQTDAPVLAHHVLFTADALHPAPRVRDGSDLLILSRTTESEHSDRFDPPVR
jgi:bifunctional DNase/RNase